MNRRDRMTTLRGGVLFILSLLFILSERGAPVPVPPVDHPVQYFRSTSSMAEVKRVVTFGEVMLRLKSPGFERLFQSPVLEATFGGAEANVAVSLCNYGLQAR